jgi:hypothetical protein
MFVSTGQGIDADTIMVSVHKNYADSIKFYHVFRRDWGGHVEDFKIFLTRSKGSVQMKHFSFNYLIDAYHRKSNR